MPQLGQGVEELRLRLTSLVGSNGLRTTKAGYLTGQEDACHSVSCDVRDGDNFWPAGETVDCNEAVCVAR
jgi:hypothetical protein